MAQNQQTLKRPIKSEEGIGLHTGKFSTVELCPAEVDTGIVFQRTDIGEEIRLSVENTQGVDLYTVLANPEAQSRGVKTIEHLVSAFCGMGVDNVLVKVNGPEIPILDGSALPWAELINNVGLLDQGVKANLLNVDEEVVLEDKRSSLSAMPYSGLKITIENGYPGLEYAEGPLEREITPEVFLNEIAPARTFCMEADIRALKESGQKDLVQSFDYFEKNPDKACAVMFGENGQPVAGQVLRFDDEPLRHKILDFLGDMFVEGKRLQGKFHLNYPRHSLNSQFLEKMSKEKELA